MIQTINGWTKTKMKARIRRYNDGTQAKEIVDGQSRCLYITPLGNRCAVGCFLTKEQAKEADENQLTGTEVAKRWPEKMPIPPKGINELQDIHDDCDPSQNVQEELYDWIDKRVVDSPKGTR